MSAPADLSAALGVAIAIAIAAIAWRRGSLSNSGAVAATAVGALVFCAGGFAAGLLLVFFFVSSTLLGRLSAPSKRRAAEKAVKGDRRDAAQVLANGGLAAALALAGALLPWPGWGAALVGTLAAVTADTWASEIGTLSRQAPRSILTGRRIEVGLSGGITALGTVASLLGGAAIGLCAGLTAGAPLRWTAIGAGAGLLGSLADSALGASAQALYACRICGERNETPRHCGGPSTLIRGHPAIDNDVVNAVAALCGALAGLGLWALLSLAAG
ncbi:MAG: DUF92 domain-containing protein [Rhodospirillales bacterium]|nr:DUF92 domain-containing protein [Rhodospirillales bacterium]